MRSGNTRKDGRRGWTLALALAAAMLVGVLAVGGGCAGPATTDEADAVRQLENRLPRLTATLRGVLRYGEAAECDTTEALLATAWKAQPELRRFFERFDVRVEVARERTPPELIVRVWDPADGRLWAEDASWTENRLEWLRSVR